MSLEGYGRKSERERRATLLLSLSDAVSGAASEDSIYAPPLISLTHSHSPLQALPGEPSWL